MMRRFVVALVFVLLSPLAARAEATGEIDWQRRVIKARGQGAPDLNAPSISSARLGAERAAKADALRNLLETLQGVQLTSGDKLGTLLQSDPALRGQVEGTLRGYKIVSPHYYADGGVGLEVEVSLDKLPAELLSRLPARAPGAAAAEAGADPAAMNVPGPATLPVPTEEAGKTPARAAQPAPVDRQAGLLRARGQGVPDPTAASVAVARIGAERAARLDAVRVLLAALRAGSAQANQMLEADKSLDSKVNGALRGYRVAAVHYYSDGGVALDVELPVDALPPELRSRLAPAP